MLSKALRPSQLRLPLDLHRRTICVGPSLRRHFVQSSLLPLNCTGFTVHKKRVIKKGLIKHYDGDYYTLMPCQNLKNEQGCALTISTCVRYEVDEKTA